jgi:hypothetical protein
MEVTLAIGVNAGLKARWMRAVRKSPANDVALGSICRRSAASRERNFPVHASQDNPNHLTD